MHCPQPGARSRAATQLPGDTCCCQAALRVSSDGRLGRLWRSCWKRTAHLHAAAHFKGTAGTYAGSTGELGFLALLTCRQLFSLTTHVQTKLYGWEVEEPCYLATSFWTEGWATSQLAELDFVMRLWQAGLGAGAAGTGHRHAAWWALPCPWSAIRSGAAGTGTGNSDLLWELQLCLQPWLAQEQLFDVQAASLLREFMMLWRRSVSFSSPPLKLCKSPVNLEGILWKQGLLALDNPSC